MLGVIARPLVRHVDKAYQTIADAEGDDQLAGQPVVGELPPLAVREPGVVGPADDHELLRRYRRVRDGRVLDRDAVSDAAEMGVRADGGRQAAQAVILVTVDGALQGTRDAHDTVGHGAYEALRVVEEAAELGHLATHVGAPVQLQEQVRGVDVVRRQPGEVGGDLEFGGEVARRGVVQSGQAD